MFDRTMLRQRGGWATFNFQQWYTPPSRLTSPVHIILMALHGPDNTHVIYVYK